MKIGGKLGETKLLSSETKYLCFYSNTLLPSVDFWIKNTEARLNSMLSAVFGIQTMGLTMELSSRKDSLDRSKMPVKLTQSIFSL